MAERHHAVVSHRVQVGIFRARRIAAGVEAAVGGVAVPVKADLSGAKLDVIGVRTGFRTRRRRWPGRSGRWLDGLGRGGREETAGREEKECGDRYDRALAALSDSVSPAGLVAVCRFLDRPLEQLWAAGDLVTICADVRDPGNAGTVIRTADAAGSAAVVLAGHSVDVYNAKTVRASVGSLFHLPIAVGAEPADVVGQARAAGMTVLAADGAGELDLVEADDTLRRPVAWLFGNEAWGLPAELADLADHRVRIPIAGRAESLNLATAAAVCLYATARARR